MGKQWSNLVFHSRSFLWGWFLALFWFLFVCFPWDTKNNSIWKQILNKFKQKKKSPGFNFGWCLFVHHTYLSPSLRVQQVTIFCWSNYSDNLCHIQELQFKIVAFFYKNLDSTNSPSAGSDFLLLPIYIHLSYKYEKSDYYDKIDYTS